MIDELVSSALHAFGFLAVVLATPRLRGLGACGVGRAAVLIHSATLAFMLAMSAAFHLGAFLWGHDAWQTLLLRRLDHLGVWVAMAGFYVLPQLLIQRGFWRWAPLAAVGLGASFWYDHRRPERIAPDPTDLPDRTNGRPVAEHTMHPTTD